MIETERLLLRPHTLLDLDASLALHSDASVLPISGEKPMSLEDMRNQLFEHAGHWSLFGYGIFAIFEKASGRLIGETGLANFQRDLGERFDQFAEAAWTFSTPARGHGYAFEAVLAVHDWFDIQFSPIHTVCKIRPSDVASYKLATKLKYRPFDQVLYQGDIVTIFERNAHGLSFGH